MSNNKTKIKKDFLNYGDYRGISLLNLDLIITYVVDNRSEVFGFHCILTFIFAVFLNSYILKIVHCC